MNTRPANKQTAWWNLARWACLVVFVPALAVLIAVIPLGNLIPVWLWGSAIFVVGISGVLGSVAHASYREALFSEAHRAVGVVVDADEQTGTDDSGPYVIAMVEAVLPDGSTIRRQLDVGGRRDAQSWLGRRVHFRHRTESPDDFRDVFYGADEMERTWQEEPIGHDDQQGSRDVRLAMAGRS